jgi:DNA-directed RNA polymerase subunit H (RpoH/RPB5)
VAQLNAQTYVILTATRPETDQRGPITSLAVIFSNTATIPNSLPEMRQLINTLVQTANPLEILLITNQPIKTKNIIETPPGITVHNYPQKIFIMDITTSVNSPKHRLVSEADVVKWEKTYRVERNSLPKILRHDPQAIYLGLQPGMVCEIDAQNEMTGVATTFRICQ